MAVELPIKNDRESVPNLDQELAGAGLTAQDVALLREYMTGAASGASYPWIQKLPLADDDLETKVGNDVYERMGNDPQIFSSTLLLIWMALRRPLMLDPALADQDSEDDAEFKRALDIRDFCERAVVNLGRHRGGVHKFLFEMLHNAIPFGHAVAEITLEEGSGEDVGKLVLKYLKVKPRQGYALIVDKFWNLIGVGAWSGDYGQWKDASLQAVKDGTVTSATTLGPGWKFVGREKFAVLTLLGRNNDPRGKSWWRPVYNSWKQKMDRLLQLDRYCRLFGLPFIWGTAATTATDQYPQKKDGTPDTTKAKITPTAAMLRVVCGLRGGDGAAIPPGAKIEVSQPTNDGGALLQTINYLNGEINQGITGQSLANRTAPHMAKAAGSVHQDTLGNPVSYLKNAVCDMFEQDVLALLVFVNYGPDALKYVPKPSLGRIDPEDLASLLTALGNALRSGGLHYTMLPEIWADWGLPRADIKAWMAELKEERDIFRAMGVPATGKDAQPGQTQGGKYVTQEAGKTVSRGIAGKAAGRHKAAFSDGDLGGLQALKQSSLDKICAGGMSVGELSTIGSLYLAVCDEIGALKEGEEA